MTTTGSVGEARWTYAVSKLAGEHMAHAYKDELGLPTCSGAAVQRLRPGPGRRRRDPARSSRPSLAGEDLVIHGDGSQIRAWCYVDDMVEGVLLCLERPTAVGESFNIGNPRSTVTIYDLARRGSTRLTGAVGEIRFQPLHYTDVELRIPNVNKARELLGFEPRVDLDEGLSRTIAWYRERQLPHWPDPARLARRRAPRRPRPSRRCSRPGQLTMGPKVEELEAELARACEVEHAVAVRRGRRRCISRVLALGIGPGDEVLVPAYTFPATANVVALSGRPARCSSTSTRAP